MSKTIEEQTSLFFDEIYKKRRKEIIHKLCIVCTFVSVAITLPYIILAYNTLVMLSLATSATFLIALYINHKNYSEIATVFTFVSISTIVWLESSITGWKTFIFLYCFPMLISIPNVVDHKKKNLLALHLIMPVSCVMLLIFTNSNLLYDHRFDQTNISIIGYFNLIFVLLISTFFVYAMVVNHNFSENTLKASEIALRIKNEELTKINKELDSFVYSLSHDIRSPVASALGLIYLIKSTNDPAMHNIFFERLELSMKGLDKFIKEVLDYSKNNRLSLKIEPVNFELLVNEIIQLNSDTTQHKDINYILKINQPYEFETDKYRLKIVLNNLISNAIKYQKADNPHKQVQVMIDVKPRQASIKVIDNGIGIEKKNLERIFEMFFRANDLNYSGTGIGLYITREALQKIKGTIHVESEYDVGTEFTINIKNMGGFYKYFEWGKAKTASQNIVEV